MHQIKPLFLLLYIHSPKNEKTTKSDSAEVHKIVDGKKMKTCENCQKDFTARGIHAHYRSCKKQNISKNTDSSTSKISDTNTTKSADTNTPKANKIDDVSNVKEKINSEFQCNLCTIKFRNQTILDSHIKYSHPERNNSESKQESKNEDEDELPLAKIYKSRKSKGAKSNIEKEVIELDTSDEIGL